MRGLVIILIILVAIGIGHGHDKASDSASASSTSKPEPQESPLCTAVKQAQEVSAQIWKDEVTTGKTDLGREAENNKKRQPIQDRRDKLDREFAANVAPLLAQGQAFKLKSARVVANESDYRHGLEIELQLDPYCWTVNAVLVPAPAVKQALADVPLDGAVTVISQLDTYEREQNFDSTGAHLNVTKITLPDGQTVVTEPVIRNAAEADKDRRHHEAFMECIGLGGSILRCHDYAVNKVR